MWVIYCRLISTFHACNSRYAINCDAEMQTWEIYAIFSFEFAGFRRKIAANLLSMKLSASARSIVVCWSKVNHEKCAHEKFLLLLEKINKFCANFTFEEMPASSHYSSTGVYFSILKRSKFKLRDDPHIISSATPQHEQK